MDANIMKVMGVVVEKGGVVVIINVEVAEVAGMDVEVAAMILFSKLFNWICIIQFCYCNLHNPIRISFFTVNSLTIMVSYMRPLFFDLRKIVVSLPILAASASQR